MRVSLSVSCSTSSWTIWVWRLLLRLCSSWWSSIYDGSHAPLPNIEYPASTCAPASGVSSRIPTVGSLSAFGFKKQVTADESEAQLHYWCCSQVGSVGANLRGGAGVVWFAIHAVQLGSNLVALGHLP